MVNGFDFSGIPKAGKKGKPEAIKEVIPKQEFDFTGIKPKEEKFDFSGIPSKIKEVIKIPFITTPEITPVKPPFDLTEIDLVTGKRRIEPPKPDEPEKLKDTRPLAVRLFTTTKPEEFAQFREELEKRPEFKFIIAIQDALKFPVALTVLEPITIAALGEIAIKVPSFGAWALKNRKILAPLLQKAITGFGAGTLTKDPGQSLITEGAKGAATNVVFEAVRGAVPPALKRLIDKRVKPIKVPVKPGLPAALSPEPTVSLEALRKSPTLAGFVLKRPKIHSSEVINEAKNIVGRPQIERHPEIISEGKSEIQFLDESPAVGLSTKKVVPTSAKIFHEEREVPITVEKEPKDLVGFSGWFKTWIAPVRFVAADNPIAQKIAHLGRDTITFMSNEQRSYTDRIEKSLKGLSKKDKQDLSILLDRELTEAEIEVMPEKMFRAYDELRTITQEMREIAEANKLADTSQWNISTEAYYPHIFVGSYQIKDGAKTIPGGFAKNIGEALDKAKEYINETGSRNVRVAPREIGEQYSATLLSRKGFGRFISEIKKATELSADEVSQLMRGVAAVKPRPKFVGNFQKRVANLEGFIDDPGLAFKIYTNRILRKKWVDPFKRRTSDMVIELPPGLRKYFDRYIDDVGGKYDPINKNFTITKPIGKATQAQGFLKLGYRPSTAIINRLQPYHTAFAEIGNYVYRGDIFKNTVEGKEIVRLSGVEAQKGKDHALEFLAPDETSVWKPLGLFSKAEKANRRSVVAGGYLYARKVFELTDEQAQRRGVDYIKNYLREFKDPKTAAIEYAKDLNVDSNYIYDISDLPQLLRTPVGRLVFQFRNYTINFMFQSSKWISEAIRNPNPHTIARASRLIASNIAVGGLKTPLRIAQLFTPRRIWNKILLALVLGVALETDPIKRRIKRTIYSGVFHNLGIDLSERVAPDIFVPKKAQDFLGATGSDIFNLVNDIQLGKKPIEIALRPFILGKDLFEYFTTPKGQIRGYRKRFFIEANEWERFLDVLGFTPSRLGIARDVSRIARDESEFDKMRKTVFVDQIIEDIEAGKPLDEAMERARRAGIIISKESIIREFQQKKLSEAQRRVRYLPREKRSKVIPLIK